MIRDLRKEAPRESERADVCVVGAGAAGICLALELERLGKRVVLVEAGGRELDDNAQDPYRSEVMGHEHRGVHTGRFRALGGTTQRWGGQILELDPEDFEPRSWVEGSGWPFAKAELAPYYKRALEMGGVDRALLNDAEVWRALRVQAPRFPGLEPYFTRWCPEPSFARLHGRALETSTDLDVWLHATAVDLLLEDETVRGVRVRTDARDGAVREAVMRAEAFVFCLGSIECVRFFLQPREGGLPWNRSGLLGRHFQDHIDVNVATVLPRDGRQFADLFDNVFLGGHKYHPKLRLAPEVQERTGSLNCALTMTFASDLDASLGALKSTAKHLLRGRWAQVRWEDGLHVVRHAPLLARQGWRYTRDHRIYNPPEATVQLRVHCEQEPEGESSLTLSGERDSFGLLRTRLDWRIAPRELATVRMITQTAAGSLRDIAELRPAPALGEDSSLAAACDDSNHHMGGMRMAASEFEGVVTPSLALHGTRNVFVCSGAVFPSSGFSNPTHTVIALALRLAAYLTERCGPIQGDAAANGQERAPVAAQR